MKKRNVLKRVLSVTMAAALMMSAASCGKDEENQPAATGDFVFGEDELTFSWYDNSDVAAATPWADTSETEKWIKENKKVTIKIGRASCRERV